ncbi:MAG: gliding motility lipoprotein GldH [Bacteroidales bacterium]|nr:gliding motility lipoprotein GldH [Bacteroidales bacterium]
MKISLYNRYRRALPDPARVFIPILFACLLLPACHSGRMYEEYQHISGEIWYPDQPVSFTTEIRDTLFPHMFYINIRNTTSYRYSNLFLFIGIRYPDGKRSRDTVECILASPDGRWLGSGMGNVRNLQVLLKRDVIFPSAGTYTFTLQQAMRDTALQGIADIGIRIERDRSIEPVTAPAR